MKKSFYAMLILMFLMIPVAGSALACDGPDCYGSGAFDIDAKAMGGAIDCDGKLIPNGAAGGISGAGGISKGDADAQVKKGEASGELHMTGGGITSTESYKFNVDADRSIGVGSTSNNYAVTGGSLDVNVDPDMGWGARGDADGRISGVAGQGSLNGSVVGGSPIFFDTKGVSGGLVGQGSVGAFEGYVDVGAGSDYYCWGYRDQYAGGHADAEINMWGGSYSESYRYVNYDQGRKTEGMGTNFDAYTNVTSNGNDYNYDGAGKCSDWSRSNVSGGFLAAGGGVSNTTQYGNGGLATSTAGGYYVGAGELGCNYDGSLHGSTYSAITSYDGMKGSVVSSGAEMSVSSKVNTDR